MKKFPERVATSLILILIVAVGLRVVMAHGYILQFPQRALAVLPFHFEAGNIAHSLATGNGFGSPFLVPTGPTAWMTPVYPFLLAEVMRALGIYTFQSFLGAVGLNIIFSVLTCLPLFYIGKRIGGVRLGALVAWLWAVFPNASLLTFEALWDASLDAFLCAAVLWLTLVLEEKPRSASVWIVYGLLWGFALMTNASFAALLPFFVGWIAFHYWRKGSVPAWKVAISIAVAASCCVPWTIRNYETFHTFVPLRSIMGLQLWLGNNSETTPIWLGKQHPIFDSHERAKYTDMGEIAYMQEKKDLAFQYMEENPRRVLELSWRRFLTVWSGGTAYPVKDFLDTGNWWFRYVLLFNVFAAFGTLVGIVILWQHQSKFAFPLAITPIVYPLPYYLTLVEPRYRLPIDPIVMLLLAITFYSLAGFREGA